MVHLIHFYILGFRRQYMQDKVKNMIVTISFITFLISVLLINLITEDKQISITERRKLTQFPEITIEKLMQGDVADKWEKYVVDQFILRDSFRSFKSFFNINIFRQKDDNGLFENEGSIYKIEYPLNKDNVKKSANKINEIYNKYLQNMNVYYTIIPDKNYYLQNDDHLKMNYNELKQIMQDKLYKIKYIDIWDSLTLEDYYKTDIHWRQEKLDKVVNVIKSNMNLNITPNNYEIKEVGDFYGTYYGQLGTKVLPDKMYILTNSTIENCSTYNYETQKSGKIYDKKVSTDKYDIYLSGATPLITIENSNANTQKELILFRDSYGSSIAPLLVENYRKITLIDIRYMSSSLLDKYIEFGNQDILFLYSTLVLNQNILK